MNPLAHTRNASGQRHLLYDHLERVASLAATFAASFDAVDLATHAGWLHDIGKIHPTFQRYLLDAEQQPQIKGHGPDHKGAGAVLATQKQLELLAFVIAGHHGGLPARADLKIWLHERARDPLVQEAISEATGVFPDLALSTSANNLFPAHLQAPLQAELFLRLLFSALVDADFLDTEEHFQPSAAIQRHMSSPIQMLWEAFELFQHRQHREVPLNQLNTLRQHVYQQCCEAASWAPGFFRLTVPTGGGKTRSSLAFALRHATAHGLHRVIYAIPYMSITEQTADVFREIFLDPHVILEHHSGMAVPDDPLNETPEQRWQRLASENWDGPLIVTTTVQLFESLFARTSSACRKLHTIARSVIILDEAQMLPAHLLEPILDVLQQLVHYYGVTVVLCTATQPALDQRFGFSGLQGIREIIPEPAQLFSQLVRVEYQWPRAGERWSWQEVAEHMQTASQSLVIVNTRADAVKMVQALAGSSPLHLSTFLCGAHRRAVIREVRRRLQAGEACHLVSTQLIEAGVDLDFPLVLRALGPVDSIAQAAGRCNREGKLSQGTVIVFDPMEGTLPPGPYRTGTMLTQALLQQGRLDQADPATYQHYFERYYALIDRDEPQVQQVRRQFDYPEVAERFRMIEEETTSVVVVYEPPERPNHVTDLLRAIEQQPAQRRSLFRQLQPYLVTLRSKELEWAKVHSLIDEVVPGLLMWKGSYDPLYGLVVSTQQRQ